MQTLKTAAIVVLLMTVMYGAYVSLTTPPEPLPDGVEDMLLASEDFDIDTGFPGTPDAPFSVDAGQVANGIPVQPGQAEATGEQTQLPAAESGVTGTLSDNTMSLSTDLPPSNPEPVAAGTSSPGLPAGTADLLEGDRIASLSASALPAVDSTTPAVEIDSSRDYPTTDGAFTMPRPDTSPTMAASESESKSGSATDDDPGLTNAIQVADRQYAAGKKKEALATLSVFYDNPNMTDEQRTQLLSRLDPLAREVIYSTDHLLEQPHRIGKTETLMDVAKQFDVPWQLLANINGVEDPVTVLPGTELKVIRGPFRADVDLSQSELTLFIGDHYAGRFPVAIGSDPAPTPGNYTVQDKQSEKTFYNADGVPVPAGSPENPYGNMWLDLGAQLSLHGSPSQDEPTDQGCISLAGAHADDLRGILSKGSSIVIRP